MPLLMHWRLALLKISNWFLVTPSAAPLFILFPYKFRVKPYPLKQIMGGWKFAPKGLVREPVCWAKMVHF